MSYNLKGQKEMKHICITYHMKRDEEIAETCITLPMSEAVAEEVLQKGADDVAAIHQILRYLAGIQGYTYFGACCSEPDARWQ